MPRAQFSLATLLWLIACVACFFGGEERQRRSDAYWFPEGGDAAPNKDEFCVTIKPDALNRLTTTVAWADGLVLTFENGRLPYGVPPGATEYVIPGRAVTYAERRVVEQQHGLTPGILNRWPANVGYRRSTAGD